MEYVLVMRRTGLPQLPHKGFVSETQLLADVVSRISSQADFLARDDVENDPAFKQIIPYAILRFEDCVLRYWRTARAGEKRLQGLYSIGWGGHVNRADEVLEFCKDARIRQTLHRELEEEVEVKRSRPPRLIGLLNDDSNRVGRVHLGLVYEYWLDSRELGPGRKKGHGRVEFVRVPELIASEAGCEEWSRLVISEYLGRETAQGSEKTRPG